MARVRKDPELFAPLHVAVVDGPIGKVWIESDGAFITRVSFEPLHVRQARTPKMLIDAQRQMDAYFKRKRKHFDVPLQHRGSRFQKLVWDSIEGIRFGDTRTYQEIADRIGGRAMARTVGNACGSNPTPIIIPCHRVLGSSGLLTGYIGGIWRKRWLLEHEGVLTKELF